ncbi:MAG: M6 family metalloprotease domain-containing protein, partial [Prevotella sp.]|nr:M6 family metalloprotease domain-containing protein [Prevotella sp.]
LRTYNVFFGVVKNVVNMKRICILSVLVALSLSVFAVPAARGLWRTLPLAGGGTVYAELRGDEFGHFWQTEDGRCFVPVSEDVAAADRVYKETDKDAIVAAAQLLRAPVAELQSKRAAKRRVTLGGEHDPYTGQKRCLVILAEFSDFKFADAHDLDFFKRMCNEENFNDGEGGNVHSVHDYFYDQSYGNLDITFDVAGPVELKYGYAYYGKNSQTSLTYSRQMILEAIDGAEEEGVDFTPYDWDGDGEVDEVFVLYAGYNAAQSDEYSDAVWPHMSSLGSYAVTYDGVTINTYACSSELAPTGKINGIGAMCHEFSHCLGLPDLYDTTYSGKFTDMSYWSLMDSGCYNGDGFVGYCPCGYTSYERMYCGWLDPVELTEETEVSGMKGLTEGGEAYIIYNQGNKNEYYLLENRSAYDYDAGLFANGLMILHLDYNANAWKGNYVNTPYLGNNHARYTYFASDNSWTETTSDLAGDPYPCSGNNHFDSSSSPSATVYNPNSDGSQMMNISVSNIAKASDGTISFRFYPAGTDPNHGNEPDGAVFYESFDYCAGAGGNDGVFGGTGIGGATFNPDLSGWTYNSAHGALQCAMFGSNTQAANVVTPTFTIDGETVLSFKAAPYTALVSGVLDISCETGGITLSESEITLPQGDWTDFAITLTGSGEVSLRIKETSGLKRFFLDEVAAVPASLSAIHSVENAASAVRKGVYTLGGVYCGESAAGLAKGIYIVDGRKYVVK